MKKIKPPTVELWLRGRPVTVQGWIEPADRSVGQYSPTFFPEVITVEDEGPAMLWWNAYDDQNEISNIFDDLSAGELAMIDEAYWDVEDAKDDTNRMVIGDFWYEGDFKTIGEGP